MRDCSTTETGFCRADVSQNYLRTEYISLDVYISHLQDRAINIHVKLEVEGKSLRA